MDNILVSCISATTETKQGDAFTVDNLKQLCVCINNRDVPININFDNDSIIGKVIYGEVINKQLKIIAKIFNGLPSSYIVPGFKVSDADYDTEKDIFTFKDIKLINMALTFSPADEGVTNFQLVQW